MGSHALNSPDNMINNSLVGSGRNPSGPMNSSGFTGQPPGSGMGHSGHFAPSPYSHSNSGMSSGLNQSTSQTCSPYTNYDPNAVPANCRPNASSGALTSSVNTPYGQMITTSAISNNPGRSANTGFPTSDLGGYRESVPDGSFRRYSLAFDNGFDILDSHIDLSSQSIGTSQLSYLFFIVSISFV